MGNKTVLCIDDEAVILDFVKMVLEMDGFDVITAESGESALELLKIDTFHTDLVLLDLMMPGLNGWETLEKIRELPDRIKLPVIIFTGNASQRDQLSTNPLVEEIDDFILKPVDYEDLLNRIKKVID